MNRVLAVLIFLVGLASVQATRVPEYDPSEDEISEHRKKVYKFARDYIVSTFNLTIIEEGEFNPVRFNSIGVWGDFETRLKELGAHRFEVQGWLIPEGHGGDQVFWYVVIEYELEHPEAWRYRWVDREYSNEPKYLGWKFGHYRSVPYEAKYSEDFLASLKKKSRVLR